jgi:hypothetical protein
VSAVPESCLLRGLAWEDFDDGRPHRLKMGKHFRGELRSAEEEAISAALAVGRVVRTLRDEFGKRNHYLWIQFADEELALGEPCRRCGSMRLERTHEHFGRCPVCQARIIFRGVYTGVDSDSQRMKGRRQARGKTPLEWFNSVALAPWKVADGYDVWRGSGRDVNGRPVLLLLEYPLDEHGRRRADADGTEIFQLRAWPADPFQDVLDLERLEHVDTEQRGSSPPR